jgi:hypothetical protein
VVTRHLVLILRCPLLPVADMRIGGPVETVKIVSTVGIRVIFPNDVRLFLPQIVVPEK